MLGKRRRDVGDPTLGRLPGTIARLIQFTILTRTTRGRTKTTTIRLLTTLLNPDAFPAAQLAALYAERWEIEPDRPKTHLRAHRGRTTNQAHRGSDLHHHDRSIKSTQTRQKSRKLRAVSSNLVMRVRVPAPILMPGAGLLYGWDSSTPT